MNDNMKYIVFEGPYDIKTPIIFPPTLKHSEVARLIRWKVISAGFVKIVGSVETYGESISLETKSRKEDGNLIARFL